MASAVSFSFTASKWFRWISAFLLWLLFLTLVQAQNRFEEVQTLLYLKSSLEVVDQRGSGGTVLEPRGFWSSWKETDKNPCAWVGVTCTDNFTVEAIDLSGWGLYRLWSLDILSNLKDLRQLDLSNNNFGPSEGTGTIPDTVGNLTQVIRLDFSFNNFVGEIPPTINECRSLRYLSLEQNNLQGPIPSLPGLVNLQVLSLAHNQLVGSIPDQFQELTSLVSLDLSNNMLSGAILPLSNLTNLLDLNLDKNNFTKFGDPQFPSSRSLKHMFVSGNQLEGPIPPGLAHMLDLEVLNMSANRLSGKIPVGLARQLNHSFWLDLSQNQLTGEIPADLLLPSRPQAVVSLNLSHNLLTGNIHTNAGGRWFFDVLDLSHNQLSGPIPFLRNENNLIYYLYLQNNNFSGDIIDILYDGQGFFYTREMLFQNNVFTGDLTRMVGNWSKFAYKLEVLDLSNNNLHMSTTTEYPDPLRSTLEDFMGGVLREFRSGGNNFRGTSLPAEYLSGYNTVLEVLDLSNSHLQGEISGAVFNNTWFGGLHILNLSNNEVTGRLPDNVVMLSNLTVLDVSNNNLSGVLPAIPTTSSLHNPRFYAGNVGLCGDPLPACPSNPIIDPPIIRRTGVRWWVLLIIVAGAVTISICSCLIVAWRWRVYSRRHQQDADLIKTLMERETASLMALRDLRKATDNFAESAQIGAGGFGTVFLGKLNDGTTVAIKRSKREGTEIDKDQFLNEVRILSQVNHRHLVKLLGCCMENKIALLVLEFVPNGTLQEHLRGRKAERLSWKQRLRIAVQTANALDYLHSAANFPIYHRDVKSANILLSNDLNAKVSDFGISKLVPVEATHASTVAVQGTMGYIDPEYYTSYQLTGKSDVYSFGVVLLELISAKPALDFERGGDDTSLVNFATRCIPSDDLQQILDPVLADTYNDPDGKGRESILNVGRLALRCVDLRSKARPTMNEVWKELQALYCEVDGTSDFMVSCDELRSDSPRGTIPLLSGFALDDSTTFGDGLSVGECKSTENRNSRGNIEMSPFSPR